MPLSVLSSVGAVSQTHVLVKMFAAVTLISNGYRSLRFTFFFFSCFGWYMLFCLPAAASFLYPRSGTSPSVKLSWIWAKHNGELVEIKVLSW